MGLLAFIFLATTGATAQDTGDLVFSEGTSAVMVAYKEAMPDDTPDYYRHHQKLSGYFSGYAIELTTSDFPLERNYYLFERFGSVKIDKIPQGGFSYLITGFKNEAAAKIHLDRIVIHQAPEAKVVYYTKGRRK